MSRIARGHHRPYDIYGHKCPHRVRPRKDVPIRFTQGRPQQDVLGGDIYVHFYFCPFVDIQRKGAWAVLYRKCPGSFEA